MIKKVYAPLFLVLMFSASIFAYATSDPCAGPSALLNLVDRPTKSDSACAVPAKQAILETGYQILNIPNGATANNFPQAEFRLGLPYANEFVALLPNYNLQSATPTSGYDASVIGVKHEIGYSGPWLFAIEGLLTLPTGGGGFGGNKYDPAVNGVIDYTFNSALSLTLMLGVGTESLPASVSGQRYTSVNPDLVFTWQVNTNWQTYLEVYGQSSAAPHQGVVFDTDLGILYLLIKNVAVDAEYGQHLRGNLGGYTNYAGVGMSLVLS